MIAGLGFLIFINAVVALMVEHLSCKQGVTGSNPVGSLMACSIMVLYLVCNEKIWVRFSTGQ